jgi:protein-S-isoprenylcysteine O-methyltransferase
MNMFEEQGNPALFTSRGAGSAGVLLAFCGAVFGFGFGTALMSENFNGLGWYLMLMGWFHWSEWLCAALFNEKLCTSDSTLLNHSPAYHYAFCAAVVEYVIEWYFCPSWKNSALIYAPAVLVAVGGLGVRFVALVKAKTAFTHIIQESKRDEHQLVTGGIYAYIRHPGYFGWFYWTIASQLILANPICALGFAYQAWSFFADRIPREEKELSSPEFFGQEYVDFRNRVPTLIPFIK